MTRLYVIFIFLIFFKFAATGQIREDIGPESRSEIQKSIHIYPNPAIDFVNIRFDNHPASHLTVTVHNIIGNAIPVEMEIVDEFELRIRVKDLDSGYYLLAVKDEENRFKGTYKFLKK